MAQKQIGLKLEVELLARLDGEVRRRGCSRKDAIEAGVLLWLQDPPAGRKVWSGKLEASKEERLAVAQEHGVAPASSWLRHAVTCRCAVCQAA